MRNRTRGTSRQTEPKLATPTRGTPSPVYRVNNLWPNDMHKPLHFTTLIGTKVKNQISTVQIHQHQKLSDNGKVTSKKGTKKQKTLLIPVGAGCSARNVALCRVCCSQCRCCWPYCDQLLIVAITRSCAQPPPLLG